MSAPSSFIVPRGVLENLKCVCCAWYLSVPPIMTLTSSNLICGRCVQSYDSSAFYCRATSYEIMAEFLSFPCRYANAGCPEQDLPWNSVKDHELSCDFRYRDCPVTILESCKWRGNWTMLLEHFQADHKDFINSEFYVNLNVTNCEVKLIALQGHIFLAHIFINTMNEKLSISIQRLGMPKRVEQFSYKMNFRSIESNDNKKLAFENDIKSKFDWRLEESSMCHLKIGFMKDILSQTKIVCAIEFFIGAIQLQSTGKDTAGSHTQICTSEISSKQHKEPIKGASYDIDLLTDLECPICLEFMVPPIFVCRNGHSMCGDCQQKVKTCSTCRVSLGNTRNYLLERLTSHIRYPCKNKNSGCKYVGNSSDVTDHNGKCSWKDSECLLKVPERCTWKGSSADLFQHLLSRHKEKLWETRGRTVLRDLTARNVVDYNIMHHEDQFFKVSCKHSLKPLGSILWSFQHIGLKPEEESPYKFLIEFLEPRGSNRELRMDSLCEAETKFEDIFNSAVAVPYSLLTPFISSDKVLHLRYEIQRV